MSTSEAITESSESAASRRLSYKFQRLRERVRDAIASGELVGKLPGERVLARRFKVNAKTLSKALSDLAAEGLLERSIGLGTFVRGASTTREAVRVLFLHDAAQSQCAIIKGLCDHAKFEVQPWDAATDMPLTMLASYKWVVICSEAFTDEMLRDLVVRGKNVVMLNRPRNYYSTHGVSFDYAGVSTDLARRLIRLGHTRVALVGESDLAELTRDIAQALPASVAIKNITPDEIPSAIAGGTTALICHSPELAQRAIDQCQINNVSIPGQLNIVAMGIDRGSITCSGQYLTVEDAVTAVSHVLLEAPAHRPVGVWLSGEYQERNTIAAIV